MKVFFTITVFLISLKCLGQPGGDGGLQIGSLCFFDINWQKNFIIDSKDTNLQVKYFIIDPTSPYASPKQIPAPDRNRYSFYKLNFKEAIIYLAPFIDSEVKPFRQYLPNQRIQVIYKRDTMYVDFFGIPVIGNAGGTTDMMDTLQFYPNSYWKFNRDYKERLSYYFDFKNQLPDYNTRLLQDSIKKMLQFGMTNYTLQTLCNFKLVEPYRAMKKLIVVQELKLDTLYFPYIPVYNLELQDINLLENTYGGDKIELHTKERPLLIDNKLQYKFILNHRFKPVDFFDLGKGKNVEDEFANSLFGKLKTNTLLINNKLYTGVLKIIVNGYWYDLAKRPQGQLNMYLYEYSNGTLVCERIISNVSVYDENLVDVHTN